MPSKFFRQKRGKVTVEVRYDDETCQTIDEVVTPDIHLERMDINKVWLSVNGFHIWITTGPRAAISITGSPDDCHEISQ